MTEVRLKKEQTESDNIHVYIKGSRKQTSIVLSLGKPARPHFLSCVKALCSSKLGEKADMSLCFLELKCITTLRKIFRI